MINGKAVKQMQYIDIVKQSLLIPFCLPSKKNGMEGLWYC